MAINGLLHMRMPVVSLSIPPLQLNPFNGSSSEPSHSLFPVMPCKAGREGRGEGGGERGRGGEREGRREGGKGREKRREGEREREGGREGGKGRERVREGERE